MLIDHKVMDIFLYLTDHIFISFVESIVCDSIFVWTRFTGAKLLYILFDSYILSRTLLKIKSASNRQLVPSYNDSLMKSKITNLLQWKLYQLRGEKVSILEVRSHKPTGIGKQSYSFLNQVNLTTVDIHEISKIHSTSYDVIISLYNLGPLQCLTQTVIFNFYRILKPNGILIFAEHLIHSSGLLFCQLAKRILLSPQNNNQDIPYLQALYKTEFSYIEFERKRYCTDAQNSNCSISPIFCTTIFGHALKK
ncbi:hypothetical protein GJ496_009221 [Pomphorhynchus laevis]|nr:hypothetical protein GJ496_009221 [Pomphorhynchus laevis]